MQEGRDEEGVCAEPCNGTAQTGGGEAELGNQNGSREAPGNHLEYPCQYGESGKTDALNHEADDVYQSQREKEQCADHQVQPYIAEDLQILFLHKHRCQRLSQKEGDEKGHDGIDRPQKDAGL